MFIYHKNPGNPEPQKKTYGEKSAFIRTLEIGESFDIKKSEQNKIYSLFKQQGMKCMTKSIGNDTIRVWRTA